MCENLVSRNLISRHLLSPSVPRRRAMRSFAADLIAAIALGAIAASARGERCRRNVQRMALARELSGEIEVLVAANPCFGLDFAATRTFGLS